MKYTTSALAALLLLAACNPSAETNNPAVATEESTAERVAEAPAVGANSFTEDQVRGHLVENGFTQPSGLTQQEDGTWRGQAMKGGVTSTVTVDYQGNVVVAQ